jgi:CheY-like chemotaxis protein/TolA-binding protein
MFENPFANRSYLVIDDFGDMRTMIRGLLRMLGGTEIDAARDGREAVELMEQKRYDVILCDYNLGQGKDGQQVLEEARQRKLIDLATVFVMVTAENTREMVMGAVDYEPDNYLAKPFTKDLLRTRLERLFQRKHDLLPISRAVARQDYASALQLIEERIAAKPKNLSDLTKLQADVCIEAGLLDQAEAIYEKVLSRRDVPWARLGMGKVYFARKSYVEAEQVFSNLVKDVNTLTAAYDWLARTQRALGDLSGAQGTLEKAVVLSPKVIKRQQLLGDLAMTNRNLGKAEQAFADAVRLGRHSVYNHPSMHAGLATAKSAAGKHDEALEVISNIGKTFDDSDEARFFMLAAEAGVKQNQGDTDAAETRFAAASQLYEKMGQAASRQLGLEFARTATRLGKTDKSTEILKAVIQNNHDDDDFIAEATEVYRAAAATEDADGVVKGIRQEIIAMNNQGVRRIREGDLDGAIAIFQQAADGMPGNTTINLNAARAMILKMERQGLDKALSLKVRDYIARIKRLAPDDHRLLWVTEHFQKLVLSA